MDTFEKLVITCGVILLISCGLLAKVDDRKWEIYKKENSCQYVGKTDGVLRRYIDGVQVGVSADDKRDKWQCGDKLVIR